MTSQQSAVSEHSDRFRSRKVVESVVKAECHQIKLRAAVLPLLRYSVFLEL